MSPWYPLNNSLGGPQSQSGHFGEEKKFAHVRSTTLDCSAHSLVIISTEVSKLLILQLYRKEKLAYLECIESNFIWVF